MIYILLCEKNKWYIGYTDRQDGERFDEHFSNIGSKWTQKYKPIQVMEWREGTLEDENKVTLEYMQKYGWWNVRGGSYCNVDMCNPPKQLMPLLPKPINQPNNIPIKQYVKKPVDKPKSVNKPINKPTYVKKTKSCYKCGRDSHTASNCYASTHVNGYYID
jgi:predicted GIY-YIG superfamily endonuclease